MITYLTGDATQPVQRPAVIAHVCNDVGAWGSGFVVALSRRWPEPERLYRFWARVGDEATPPFALGAVHVMDVEYHLYVANMIAQHGLGSKDGVPAIRYDALETALAQVHAHARRLGASVHLPRIGCGLGGGRWEQIEPIIFRTLVDVEHPVDVYVYDLSA